MTKEKLDNIRENLEKMFRELEYELYLEGAGLKTTVNTTAIYKKYQNIFSTEKIRKLKEVIEQEKDNSEKKKLEY